MYIYVCKLVLMMQFKINMSLYYLWVVLFIVYIFSTSTYRDKYCVEFIKMFKRQGKNSSYWELSYAIITENVLINLCQYCVSCYSYLHNFIIRNIVQCLNITMKISTYVIFFLLVFLFTITSSVHDNRQRINHYTAKSSKKNC